MRRLFLLASATLLFACSTPTKTDNGEPVDPARDTVAGRGTAIDTSGWTDCARGIPEPVLDIKKYPTRTFTLLPDKAVETATLANGDKLVIEHSGCEYVFLTINFQTERLKPIGVDSTKMDRWFAMAAESMEWATKDFDAPLDIEGGIKKLRQIAKTPDRENGRKLNWDYDYGTGVPGDMLQTVSINRIEEKGTTTTMEVTFAIGPL